MDFLIELIFELVVEGGIEICSNKKINKWIRYPILGVIALFFSIIIFGLIFIGIRLIDENIIGGLFIASIGILLLILGIIKFKKVYLERKKTS